MGKYIVVLGLLVLLSCKKHAQRSPEREEDQLTVIQNAKKDTNTSVLKNHHLFHTILVGLAASDRDKKDVYKNYGLDTTLACYSCELATIYINSAQKKLFVYNFCNHGQKALDEKENLSYAILDLNPIDSNTLVFTILKNEKKILLSLHRVASSPVFKLTNYKLLNTESDNFKVLEFFVSKPYLEKFEPHGCDDFEG